jgi:hypothetical protein
MSKSVNFVVGAARLQENRLRIFVLDEAEDDPQVVTCATGPRAIELPLQLMRSETRIEGIFCEELKRGEEILFDSGIFFDRLSRCALKRGRGYESTPQERMLLRIVDGVAGWHLPAA